MKIGLLRRLFPTPRYLAEPASGFDLSDRSLKFVTLGETSHGLRLVACGEKSLPLDVISAGEIKNKPALIEILKAARAEWGLNQVIAALPEEKAYIVRIHLPNLPRGEESEAVELQLSENVPLPANEAVFDYEIVPGENRHHAVIVSALPQTLVADYEEVLTSAGFSPLAFEVEAQAVARAVIPAGDTETTLVIDFGKTRTSFFVVRHNQVLFTSTTAQLGGDILVRAIEKNLNLNNAAAEKLERERGLLVGPDQEKLLAALVPPLSVLRDEILKLQEFWQKHLQNSGAGEGEVHQILLCGGEAGLPGLVDYLAGQLSVAVALGNVWSNILDLNQNVPPLSRRESLRYATAIGLALRSYQHD